MSTEPIDVDSTEVGVDDAPAGEVVALPDRYAFDAEQHYAVEQMGPVASDEFKALAAQAVVLSQSGICPKALRGKPHDMLQVLMSARDLGLAPTVAMRKLYVVDGQVTIAPALKMALVRIKGAGRIWYHQENDAQECTVYGQRTGEDYVHTVTVTIEDAARIKTRINGKTAPLTEKDNWKNYPARMLQWRAVGYLIDDLWPEVSFGMYSPDELGAYTDEDGHVIDVESVDVPEGFERQQRRAKTPTTVVAFKARLKDLPDDLREKMDAWYQDKVWEAATEEVPWDDLPESWWPHVDGLLTKAEAKAKDATYTDPDDGKPAACLACGSTAEPCECAPDGAQDEPEAMGREEANARYERDRAEALADGEPPDSF